MNNLFHSIQTLQKLLMDAGLPSIVIGGLAVAAWGEPRVTRDADLKVLLSREDADRLLELLHTDYLSLLPLPIEALKKQGMVFIQDSAGTRLDILLADTSFDIEAISRGREIEIIPGTTIRVCTAEDLIIYKLISTRLRDHEDAKSVIRRQGSLLDERYLLKWLREFEQALDDSTFVNTLQTLKKQTHS